MDEQELSLLKKALELSGEELLKVYNLLTPVEQAILKVLIVEKTALSAKEIRNKLIDYLITYFEYVYTLANYKSYSVTPKFDLIQSLFFEELEENIPEDTAKKIAEELISKLKNIESSTEKRAIAEKIIKNYKIAEIPSFQTIEKILTELVASGLVIRRKPIYSSKVKFVYAINPNLLNKINFDKMISEISRELDHYLDSVEKEVVLTDIKNILEKYFSPLLI
jgi:type III secretion system FlhB-like substrate exporter